MDDIVFYQPPSASRSQSRLAGIIPASHLPLEPIASLPTRHTDTFVSTLSQKLQTSDRYCIDDKQENSTAPENLPNRSNDDDFPDIEKLLSGTRQKTVQASANLNSDDPDSSIDIDELLSDIQPKELTSITLDCGGITDVVENGTRSSSPTSSSRSTTGSSRDPIIVGDSDDEYAGAEPETDYSSLNADVTARSDSSSPHIADSDMADDKGFDSGATYNSDRLVADHQNDNNNSNVVDRETAQLAADFPISPRHRSVTYQASYIRLSSEIIHGSASYNDLDVTKKAEDEGIDIFADDEDDFDICAIRRSGSSAVPSDNSASGSNVALAQLRGSQHSSAQFPQLDSAAASPQQSDSTDSPLPRNHRRRDNTKNVRRKRLRMASAPGPASVTSPVSAALESTDFEYTQSVSRLTTPAKERETRDIDHEMANYGGSDDSDDEDYDDRNDATTSDIRHPPHSRKQVKLAKDTEGNGAENSSIPTSSISLPESEEIPIIGHLTLKAIDSTVVYCLTFSQELLLEPSGLSQRQGLPRVISSSSDRKDGERLYLQEKTKSRPVRNSRFSAQEDELLVQLKGDGLSWDEISDHFSERSKGTLQVHYSTKLRPRVETPKGTKKRRRSG